MTTEKTLGDFKVKKILVTSSNHSYPIYLGTNLYKDLPDFFPKTYSKIFIITDSNLANYHLDKLLKALKKYDTCLEIIPPGEQSKSLETYYHLQSQALLNGLDRNSLIIAFGGGVIGDLAGFVAATFMRGIDYFQLPTTILAHDSSVGGKVAINHELGKNLIGSFYPPRAVVFDLNTIKTLASPEVRSGYAEIVKASLIGRKENFLEIMNLSLKDITSEELYQHILESILVKKEIVERDERESFERMYLNLGHTLGHAIELNHENGQFLHGEAVAIGLLFSLFISESLFKVNLPLKKLYDWMKRNYYPLSLENITIDSLIKMMKQDKKNKGQLISFILLKDFNQLLVKSFKKKEIKDYLTLFFKSLSGGFND